MRFVTLATFLTTIAAAPAALAENPLRLRLVSWNVWGVPAITPHLDERMAALPGALAALDPDIVCFQEVWDARHAEQVGSALAERGLRHLRRFEAPAGLTGLLVASKFPLSDGGFRPFSMGRMPHSFWHLDWMVEKGVADVTVATPLGGLRLENTHLQAQYRTDHYDAERLAQASELVLDGRARASEALLLAGDFNSSGSSLPRRVLGELGRLEDASPSSSEDSVYVRSGRNLSLRVVSARTMLGQAFPLGNGLAAPLSDHAALLVEIELARGEDSAPALHSSSAKRAEAVTMLERAADITPSRVAFALLIALGLGALLVSGARRTRKLAAEPRSRVALRALALAILGAGFVWSSYLAVFYYPTRSRVLRSVARELSSLAER
jgi:endonuclease/exonuclease/phosphatase family metal-dependent hydrolase